MRTMKHLMKSADDAVSASREMWSHPNQSRLRRCGTDALTRVHEPQNYFYGEPGCWCVSILDYGATGVTVMHETRIRHSPPSSLAKR